MRSQLQFSRVRSSSAWIVSWFVFSFAFFANVANVAAASRASDRAANEQPNFIVIFTDDQGYNDLGCFGSTSIETPNIDRMAAEGRRYTSFYVPCSVCSPSRAALLTGCYPKRVGMHKHVLFPQSDYGLNPAEYTIADHLSSIGYATACIGKWHLGHHPETLPRANGFDSYFGIPYSNDMNHPDNKRISRISSNDLWRDQSTAVSNWNTPLINNEEIVELPVDQRTITRRYTDKAIEFVTSNKDQPFFLYLPHSMPHIPLYVPADAYDADPKNAYKCVIEHIDAEVGRLVQTVRDLGLSENTYVIYTSDNGPWLQFKNHGGSAFPLRAGKATTFEGGQRVPCVMWAPGRIPAGTSTDAFTSTLDLLPTIASITKQPLPDRKIDGQDISSTFATDDSAREELIYYSAHGDLQGIRQGDWKYLEHAPRRRRNQPKPKTTMYLFDLASDISEQVNLLDANPDVAAELKARMIAVDGEISANARSVWRKTQEAKGAKATKKANEKLKIVPPSEQLREQFSLDSHYQKSVVLNGFPIVASNEVPDAALQEAAVLIGQMLKNRPDVLRTLAENKIRFGIMSTEERTCDLPEHSDLTPREFWNRRARGLGATRSRPAVSCGAENLLHNPGDPYSTESILVHEFAHAIHLMAVNELDPTFDRRLESTFKDAMDRGLWKGLYAAENSREYFAEAVQSWFGTNRENDSLHNHVNTRQELIEYDPGVAKLCAEVFGANDWRYVRADDASRADEPHLKQLDRSSLSKFEWSKEEQAAYDAIASGGKLK